MTRFSHRPIKITAKGCKFRSKLEWRFTEFFDALKIEWQYEPQVFDISTLVPTLSKSKRWYLPDFYLPAYDLYLEVKPRIQGGIPRLRLEALAKITNKPVLMSENFYKFPPEFWWFHPDWTPIAKLPRKLYAKFFVCPTCRRIGINQLGLQCPPHCNKPNFTHPVILQALARTLKPHPTNTTTT